MGHVLDVLPPWPYRPGLHDPEQCGPDWAARPKRPGRQSPEHLLVPAPTRPKWPAGQSWQRALPGAAENRPALHAMHAALEEWLYFPGAQTPEQSSDGLPPFP